MSHEYDRAAEVKEAGEVFAMVFPPHDESSEVAQPGKESIELPTSPVTAQSAAVLGAALSIRPIVRDYSDDMDLSQLPVERIAVVGVVTDEPPWRL